MTFRGAELVGKIALVTGASRGIGEATAVRLAELGAEVIVTSRKVDACEAVAEKLRACGGKAEARALHIGDRDAISALFAALEAEGRAPDVLINNAAANPYFGPAIDQDPSSFDKTVDVNIRGYFHASQQAAKRMRAKGGGAIVNVASVNAVRPAPGQLVYSMTKAAIVAMTQGFARELAGDGIRVNVVLPGLTDTHFASAITGNDALRKLMLKQIPVGRIAAPDEIAPLIAFLATPAAGYITGAAFTADGGFLA